MKPSFRIKEMQATIERWKQRAKEAEAELARRDAQEPAAYRWEGKSSGNICYDGIKPLGVMSQPLFLRAPSAEPRPAVLPSIVDTSDLDRNSKDREDIRNIAECDGWNACVKAAIALGCQPQRFVVSDCAFNDGLNALNYWLDDCGDSERGLRLALRVIQESTGGEVAE